MERRSQLFQQVSDYTCHYQHTASPEVANRATMEPMLVQALENSSFALVETRLLGLVLC
jgi:hypothetical protein